VTQKREKHMKILDFLKRKLFPTPEQRSVDRCCDIISMTSQITSPDLLIISDYLRAVSEYRIKKAGLN
jgi:hypothetical protein